MISKNTIITLLCCGLCLLTSCAKDGHSHNSVSDKENRDAKLCIADKALNDEARVMAGLPVNTSNKKLKEITRSPQWKTHEENMNRIWNIYQQTSPKLMGFAQDELTDVDDDCNFIFYPFSGPDFLFANALFPKMQTYLLVGLEKVGTRVKVKRPTVNTYQLYENAVSGIFNLSFFSTEDMRSKNSDDTISGVLPLIEILMARTKREIVSIKYKKLTTGGNIEQADSTSNMVEIKFFKQGSHFLQTLYYVSSDLQNRLFARNLGLQNFIKKNQQQSICFTKSASYLMHTDAFSYVRSFILDNSQVIVQDDSGIPWKYFLPDEWDNTLYGSYHTPIDEYIDYKQDDLESAYQKADPEILDFRIGYSRQSNLQIFTRK